MRPSTEEVVATDVEGITPFRVAVPQPDLDDLRARIAHTRWPQSPGASGWERGVPLDYLRRLAAYWADAFDWRAQEAALNQIPQFVTTFEGQEFHFLHVRSPHAEARPLIMIHGWPSSPVEFLKVIGPLTDPVAYGGDPADAFHVVVPSVPGYGFSTPLREGWGNLFRVAATMAQLMAKLGYQRYGAYGTDAGAGVAGMMGMVDGERVTGVYVTGAVAAMPFGPPVELDGLAGVDRSRAERFNAYQQNGLGYLHLQATRPQTLAYSLADSPVGQLAWIVEKFHEWTDPAFDHPDDAVDRDQLLTNVSVSWFTGAGPWSAHATYEGMQAWRAMAAQAPDGPGQQQQHSGPPTGFGVFAADTPIRSLMEATGRVDHWSEFPRGGHFPAMEAPDLLTTDLRAFFRPRR
jgi:epoxide hydrolase